MKKSIKGRFLTLIALLIIAVFFLLPSTSIYSKLPTWWGDVFPSKGVSLGLDLKGGMHLVLEVEVEKAVDNAIERMASALKGALERKEVEGPSIKVTDRLIYLSFPSDKTEVVRETLDEEFPNLITEEESGGEKVLAFREAEKNRILTTSTLQALETIRNRVDEFGVAEPLIQKQ
ncbi:Protein translocase subunit SecD, partial [hydrothermal vent metagenome]